MDTEKPNLTTMAGFSIESLI
uniref:Uncharacterized protein n=1 Tax=Anguilla anguilla TaxID=7936 RepID=A0A0E9PEN5_ANGAN